MSVRPIHVCLMVGSFLISLAAVSQAPSAQPATAQAPAAQTPTSPAPSAQAPTPQKTADDLKVVSMAGDHLKVQISEPSTLNKVFKAICTEQKLDCTGAESLTSYSVPKMTVDGTLREVVDNLLGGTGVNYRYTRATASTKAKLVLLGHAPQGNNAALPARGPVFEPPPKPLHSIPYPGPGGVKPGATEPAPDPNTDGGSEPQPQQPNGPTASNESTLSPEDQARNLAAMEMMFGGATGSDTKAAEFQPFPDRFGNPIPIDNTPVQYQPFPDQFGNPIPVKPNQPTGSPFPPAAPASNPN